MSWKVKIIGMVQIVLPSALQFHVVNAWQSTSNVKRQTSKRGEEALSDVLRLTFDGEIVKIVLNENEPCQIIHSLAGRFAPAANAGG